MAAADHPRGGARRLVSVLFADLVGFTTLSERLDSEDVATIQQAYFARARTAVEERGGTVEKFIGDAVVGTFGLPHGRGDDAGRAVAAGLAVVEGVAAVATGLGLPPGALQVRVGINTGEVHAAFAADGTWQLTGNVVNVAARLQSAAPPGGVLVGAATALAAEPAYEVEPVGDLALKGKTEPVAAWRVAGRRERPSRLWGLRGLEAPTLGRDDELARLASSLDHGGARGWLVNAPPGAGKTRLVDELDQRARAAGHPVWRSTTEGHVEAYGVVAQLLADGLRAARRTGSMDGPAGPDAAAAEREPVDPADPRLRDLLLRLLAGAGGPGPRDELAADHALAVLRGGPLDAGPADLAASWIAVLDALVPAGGPRALWIVEDVHAASPDLLAVLRLLLAAPGGDRRLVVATCRPALLAAAGPDPLPGATLVQLPPLPPAVVLDLVEALVGAGVVPPAATAGIAATAGGNPLFVEELLRTWVQADLLHRKVDGGWSFDTAAPAVSLPTTVHAVYQGQLDDLGADARRVATSGSVPGRTFPAEALPALGIEQPAAGLDELGALGLLAGPHRDVDERAAYTYRHALLRDVAYATLAKRDRARLHLRFARWIAATGDAATDELVGTHLAAASASLPALGPAADDEGRPVTRAEVAAEAGLRLVRAAERSLTGQPGRAAELLAWALEVDTAAAASVAAHRHARRAEALRQAGRLDEAMRAFVTAGDLAGAARDGTGRSGPDTAAPPGDPGETGEPGDPDRETLTAAALGYEEALFASRLPRTVWGPDGERLLDAALAAVPGTGEHAAGPATGTAARLLAARGRAATYGGDPVAGARWADRAVVLARAAGDDAARAHALLAVRAGLTRPGDNPARRAAATELIAAARAAGDAEAVTEGLRLRFVDHLEAGLVEEAAADRAAAEAAIVALRRPLYLWYPAMWRAMEAIRTGDPDGPALVEAFRREGERWQYGDVRLVHAVQGLAVAVEGGDPAYGLPLIDVLPTDDLDRIAVVRAWGLAAAGRPEDARRMLDVQAGDGFATMPRDLSWLYNLALAADVAAALDEHRTAAVVADLLEPWVGGLVVLGSGALCLGAVSHFAGVARAAAGQPDRARVLLTDAVGLNRRTGCRPAAARSAAALDCLDRGRPFLFPGTAP